MNNTSKENEEVSKYVRNFHLLNLLFLPLPILWKNNILFFVEIFQPYFIRPKMTKLHRAHQGCIHISVNTVVEFHGEAGEI